MDTKDGGQEGHKGDTATPRVGTRGTKKDRGPEGHVNESLDTKGSAQSTEEAEDVGVSGRGVVKDAEITEMWGTGTQWDKG